MFIEARVREAKEHGHDLSRDIQEAVALRWLLEKAGLPAPPSPGPLDDELDPNYKD